MGESGLPTILSCGMSTLAEIDQAVRAFRDTGNPHLLLLHCTSSYPTPPEDAHLRKIGTLLRTFDLPVGLSDHTEGPLAAALAVTLGAQVIEKHFTTDRELPGPDHRFSSDPAEFARLAGDVSAARRLLGVPQLGPTEGESTSRDEYRLSCVAARDLPAGHVLAAEDLGYKRPGTGIPPHAARYLIGRTTRQAIPANTRIELTQFH